MLENVDNFNNHQYAKPNSKSSNGTQKDVFQMKKALDGWQDRMQIGQALFFLICEIKGETSEEDKRTIRKRIVRALQSNSPSMFQLEKQKSWRQNENWRKKRERPTQSESGES